MSLHTSPGLREGTQKLGEGGAGVLGEQGLLQAIEIQARMGPYRAFVIPEGKTWSTGAVQHRISIPSFPRK